MDGRKKHIREPDHPTVDTTRPDYPEVEDDPRINQYKQNYILM